MGSANYWLNWIHFLLHSCICNHWKAVFWWELNLTAPQVIAENEVGSSVLNAGSWLAEGEIRVCWLLIVLAGLTHQLGTEQKLCKAVLECLCSQASEKAEAERLLVHIAQGIPLGRSCVIHNIIALLEKWTLQLCSKDIPACISRIVRYCTSITFC